MDDKSKKNKNKKQKSKSTSDFAFKPSAEVKGLRFGGQLLVKSFTVRRASPVELIRLLSVPPGDHSQGQPRFPSTTVFLPTNFTILAHQAWHTLTLGLGTKKSKVVLFVLESEKLKAAMDRLWPPELPLGEVNKKLIRCVTGCEMARFKFRKGCLTFYVYAVRRIGDLGFSRSEDLRTILQSVVALNDFLDHTAMLALPSQKSINFSSPLAVVH